MITGIKPFTVYGEAAEKYPEEYWYKEAVFFPFVYEEGVRYMQPMYSEIKVVNAVRMEAVARKWTTAGTGTATLYLVPPPFGRSREDLKPLIIREVHYEALDNVDDKIESILKLEGFIQ